MLRLNLAYADLYCPEDEVVEMISRFPARRSAVESAIAESRLSPVAKEKYLARFFDRLKAISL